MPTPEEAQAGPQRMGPLAPALVQWLRRHPGQPLRPRRAMLWYRWSQWFFNYQLKMQRGLLKPQPLQIDPAFVLGPWRSGTTYLHELLSASSAFTCPRTWQCMAPASFGITGAPRINRSQSRPMDSFVVSADSPQEDELALLQLGLPSLYRAWLDPSRIGELSGLLDSESEALDWAAYQPWLDFLGQVAALDGAGSKQLLLKSPNHTFRAVALLNRFQRSPCVWIHRSPEQILRSNQRMWHAMCRHYGLALLRDADLDQFLLKALQRSADVLNRLSSTLPRDRFVVLELRALRQSPVECTRAIMQRWGREWTPAAEQAVSLVAQCHVARQGQSDTEVSDITWADTAMEALRNAQQRSLLSHGLERPPS
ncbi:sulfotransferase [Ideonella sp. B508-1]|uniref:sulfotransferase n=1 Tax=Ideonella sp. B508-1 TaxID=137716 RepID=UPI0009FD30E0|nr:sulfotransferase [Ideonella sp. B508-1]